MIIDRKKLKAHARELIKTGKPPVPSVALVYVLLSVFASFLVSKLMGLNMTESVLQHYIDSVSNGNLENAIYYLQNMQPPQGSYIIAFLIEAALFIVNFGFTIFLMNTYHSDQPCMGNLLDGFGIIGRVVLISLLKTLYIFLWSLLFVIPGIIAMYKYRMATYIMLENPDKSVAQCLRESKELMKGHKWECFGLDLSFIGWYLLSLLPYAGNLTSIYSLPFMGLTYISYYHALLRIKEVSQAEASSI